MKQQAGDNSFNETHRNKTQSKSGAGTKQCPNRQKVHNKSSTRAQSKELLIKML